MPFCYHRAKHPLLQISLELDNRMLEGCGLSLLGYTCDRQCKGGSAYYLSHPHIFLSCNQIDVTVVTDPLFILNEYESTG